MRNTVPLCRLVLLWFLAWGAFVEVGEVKGSPLMPAGPMIGHVSDTSGSIWVRVKRGAMLEGWARQGDEVFDISHWKVLEEDFHVVRFSGLRPDTATEVTLRVERAGSEPEEFALSFRTYPAPAATGRVRLAFGSCSKISQYPSGPIYAAIAQEEPHMMIFLGDNAYFIVADGSERHFGTTGPVGDWNFPESMRARHLLTRVHPDLQPLFRRVPSYGIWDDHDYGPNNADRTFEMREEALRVFQQMWANPGWGTDTVPGIFSSFRCGPVEVFLMDDRYHKYTAAEHEDVSREDGVIWGEDQLQWLLDGLGQSTAPVKVIANGTQIISQDTRGEGHFQEALGEQRRLLTFLQDHGLGGVVFLSGDRHHSEAMQHVQPDGTVVPEATSSPLQQDQAVGIFDRHHPAMIWGMYGNSYGLLTVDVPEEGGGTVTFEARDESNGTPRVGGDLCRTQWTLPQLSYGVDAEVWGAVPQTWKRLFNGENLEGWVQRNGTATYRVEGSVIVGRTAEGSPNSFLCTEKDYGDFVFMCEVKVDAGLNSGLQVRSRSDLSVAEGRVQGPQIEIERSPGAAGYVYSEGTGRGWLSGDRPIQDVFRNDEWNHYLVRAEGKRLRTWVNRRLVADVTEENLPESGFIGLQVHGVSEGSGPYEVRWRELALKELAEDTGE